MMWFPGFILWCFHSFSCPDLNGVLPKFKSKTVNSSGNLSVVTAPHHVTNNYKIIVFICTSHSRGCTMNDMEFAIGHRCWVKFQTGLNWLPSGGRVSFLSFFKRQWTQMHSVDHTAAYLCNALQLRGQYRGMTWVLCGVHRDKLICFYSTCFSRVVCLQLQRSITKMYCWLTKLSSVSSYNLRQNSRMGTTKRKHNHLDHWFPKCALRIPASSQRISKHISVMATLKFIMF